EPTPRRTGDAVGDKLRITVLLLASHVAPRPFVFPGWVLICWAFQARSHCTSLRSSAYGGGECPRGEIVATDLNRGSADTVPDNLHLDRKSTRLNSSHVKISYAVFCL